MNTSKMTPIERTDNKNKNKVFKKKNMYCVLNDCKCKMVVMEHLWCDFFGLNTKMVATEYSYRLPQCREHWFT